NGKCCVQGAESTPRDDVIQWRTGALACPRSFNPLPPNPRIVVNGFDKSGANRVRNDVFACPANVLVSTNHTIEGFINPQGASPAERAICWCDEMLLIRCMKALRAEFSYGVATRCT